MDDTISEFRRLSQDFKHLGATGLRRRLFAALRRSAQPAIAAAQASAAVNLPKGGGKAVRKRMVRRTGTVVVDGKTYARRRVVRARKATKNESLAKRVSAAKYTVRQVGQGDPEIRITAAARGRKKVDLNRLDEGVVRHPLFGDRHHWYSQRVKRLWFTKPMEENESRVLRELKTEVDGIVRDLNR